MLLIYAKHKDDRKFKPMDLKAGTQVSRLFFATMWGDDRKEELEKEVEKLNEENQEWKFEIRCKK